MNELDLFDVLAEPSREKLAGVLDSLKTVPKATIEYVKAHPEQVAGALVGAGALTLAQYAQNRPGKSGTSVQQRLSQKAVDATNEMKRDAKRDGKPLGLTADLAQATAPAVKGVSDVLARHPVKGALMVAPAGGMLGYTLASRFLKQGCAMPIRPTKKAAMTKLSMADQWGRELARELTKEASPVGSIMSHGVGRAMQWATGASLRNRAIAGGVAGMAGGAAKHMMGPVDPATGKRQGSLLGSMAAGTVVGAGAGAGARAAAQHIGSMNNQVGRYAGGALTRTVNQAAKGTTGSVNLAARQASMDMARARGSAQTALKTTNPEAFRKAQQESLARASQKHTVAPSPNAKPAAAPKPVKPPAAPNPAAKPQGVMDRIRGFGRTVAPSIFGP